MQILENIQLQNYNTFKVPSIARYFCDVKTVWELDELINSEVFQSNKIYFLWQWANTIFIDNYDGLVVKISILWKEILQDDDDYILLKVWAWEIWMDFVLRCAQNNFAWMENLAYIPSSVWATAVQNIWAYGVEAKDIIYQVEWINLLTWKKEVLDNSDCEFWYRDSIFKSKLKDKFLVTSVIYKLKKFIKWYPFNCEYSWILEKMWELWFKLEDISLADFVRVITEIRKSKLPDWEEIGTAWSFFKNPIVSQDIRENLSKEYINLKWFPWKDWVKLSAWQLIDLCGLKWKSNWKVWTYSNHALVLVNEWGAVWSDVVSFCDDIQKSVSNKFWVKLEPEVILVV